VELVCALGKRAERSSGTWSSLRALRQVASRTCFTVKKKGQMKKKEKSAFFCVLLFTII
jgi:hypothetical protein